MRSVLNNDKIKSVYQFGQHFQVNNAYEHYPEMFDDCNDDTLIVKLRYDGVYFDNTMLTLQSLSDAFYSITDSIIFNNFHLTTYEKVTNFDFYKLPTIMYSRIFLQSSVQFNHTPNDISFVFNTPGIKQYAKHYTDWILSHVSSNIYKNIDDLGASENVHVNSVNIHTSTGKFFLDNGFNTIDYTPINQQSKLPINVFGYIFRYKSINDTPVGDTHDDYKLRWYDGHWAISSKIIEKFGKHDNT
jgi:hypothetical protein